MSNIKHDTLKIFPDYESFFSGMNPRQLLVSYDDVQTIEQSLSKKRFSLIDMDETYQSLKRVPAPAPVDYLVKWLDFINDFSNINKRLTELTPVAYMIFKSYGHFYLSDLKLLFERLMRAEYGTFYNSVDAQRILYAFLMYDQERKSFLQRKRVKYDDELEKFRDRISSDAYAEVQKILKKDYAELVGQDYWQKRNELYSALYPKMLEENREKFLSKYGDRPQ
jgi:hypothetical protein